VIGTGRFADNIRKGSQDSDHDGLSDRVEKLIGTNAKLADTDHDGINDSEEASLGTDPTVPDTDHDGVSDGLELEYATNPLDASSTFGTPGGAAGVGAAGAGAAGAAPARAAGAGREPVGVQAFTGQHPPYQPQGLYEAYANPLYAGPAGNGLAAAAVSGTGGVGVGNGYGEGVGAIDLDTGGGDNHVLGGDLDGHPGGDLGDFGG
jgi:hypothetical protein